MRGRGGTDDSTGGWQGGGQVRRAGFCRGSARATDPFVSPVHQTWAEPAPPTLLTTGTRDLFLSDSVQLARSMRASGGEVDDRPATQEGGGGPNGPQSICLLQLQLDTSP